MENKEKIPSFVYSLSDPGSEIVRYIGVSRNPEQRLKGHLKRAKQGSQPYVYAWIRGLLQKDLLPEMRILEESNEADIDEREIFYIAKYRAEGHPLTNMADGGGKPPVGSHKGHKHSPEAKKKMSKQREKYSPEDLVAWGFTSKGRKHTEEWKREASKRRKGRNFGDSGKGKKRRPRTEEEKRKISEGLKKSNAGKKKKRKPLSEEHKRKISEGIKQRHAEGVYKKRY